MDSEDYTPEWATREEVAAGLRQARGRRTQAAVAALAKVNQSVISLYEDESKDTKPQTLETALRVATAYGLSASQTANACRVWHGATVHHVETISAVIETTKRALHIDTRPGRYIYFTPLYCRADFARVDKVWDKLQEAIQWLVKEEKENPQPHYDYLLTELGAILPHYLDARSRYTLRAKLCDAAVKAARRLEEREHIACCLLCDSLSWFYLEQLYDLPKALAYLTQGITLAQAQGNIEMEALGTAFRGWVYLRERKVQMAETDIIYALNLFPCCSEPVQTRICWALADIAAAMQEYETALMSLTTAQNLMHTLGVDEITPEVRRIHLYLTMNETEQARIILDALEPRMQRSHVSHYDKLCIEYVETEFYLHVGNAAEARSHAEQVELLLKNPIIRPYFTRDIKHLLLRV